MRSPLFAAAIFAMAASAGLVGEATKAVPPRAGVQLESRAFRKRLAGGDLGWLYGGYRRGPGWTYAQVKRMACKRRNQQRHKAACRRKRG